MTPAHRPRAPRRPLDLPTLGLTVGGLGFLRPAPGTWGSLPPPVLAALMLLAGAPVVGIQVVLFVVASLACWACVGWGPYAEVRFGRKDASEVVADETAGVVLPVLAALALVEGAVAQLVSLGGAFALFRVFDISKPWPMRRLERLPQGWGVLVDDLVAGLYAAAVLAAVLVFSGAR